MLTLVLLVALIALLASSVQGVIGFGSGMVAMALLPLLLPLTDAVAVVSVLCMTVNLLLLFRLRGALRFRPLLPMLLGALCGVPIGVVALQRLDASSLKVVLGGAMIAYVLAKAASARFGEHTLPDRWGFPFALAGGVLGGGFNVGGPPVLIYVTMKAWDKDLLKGTLQAYFCVISAVQIPLLIGSGLLGGQHLEMIAAGVPAALCGVALGSWLYDRMDNAFFSILVLYGIGLSGLFYLLAGLTS